jgi:hypothetical protein
LLNAGSNQTLRVTFTPANTNAYAMVTAMVSLNVQMANQMITFAAISNLVVEVPQQLAATASSGLPVSFSVVSGPATVLGNVLTATNAGTVVVAAAQVGNTNYNAAPVVTETVTVSGGVVVTPPVLGIYLIGGGEIGLFWPGPATGFLLQTSSNLFPGSLWLDVTNVFETNGSIISTTVSPAGTSGFYRLVLPAGQR